MDLRSKISSGFWQSSGLVCTHWMVSFLCTSGLNSPKFSLLNQGCLHHSLHLSLCSLNVQNFQILTHTKLVTQGNHWSGRVSFFWQDEFKLLAIQMKVMVTWKRNNLWLYLGLVQKKKPQIIYFPRPDRDWKIKFQSPLLRMSSRRVTHRVVGSQIADNKTIICVGTCGVSKELIVLWKGRVISWNSEFVLPVPNKTD